jgi:beta-lactamase regulating signal transducer with metallopeptidase domain
MEVLTRLLEITIYAAILFLAVAAVKKIFGSRMSPRMHYMIWFILLLRLCVPFTIDSGIRLVVLPAQLPAGAPIAAEAGREDPTALSPAFRYDANTPAAAPQTPSADVSGQPQSGKTGQNTINIFREIASVKWTDVLLAVWVLGMLLQALWTLRTAFRMNRFIHCRGIAPPPRVTALLEKCRAELGIKRGIPMCLMPDITTPALTIGFNPRMVLPAGMAEAMTDEQLSFAIKHELMHYRRKDHIAGMVLRMLEAVYWFNPFVWLMSRCMLSDMETACDSDVVKALGKQAKKQYVLTLLGMFSQEKAPQFLLGMALHSSEKAAEKRVRGVYMRHTSKCSVKITAGILAAMLFVCCFTTACQPTPAKEVVVGKADLEKKIEGSAAPLNRYTAPDKVSDSVSKNNVTVKFDASVEVPDAEKFPAYKVELTPFTQEQIDKVGGYLLQGRPIYAIPENFYDPTKSELQEEILHCQKDIQNIKKMDQAEINNVYDGETRDEAIGELNKYIDELEKKLPTALDKFPGERKPATLAPVEFDNRLGKGKWVDVIADAKNGLTSSFYCSGSMMYYCYNTGFSDPEPALEKKEYMERNNIETGEKETEKSIRMTREEAESQAQQALQAMGIANMRIASVKLADFEVASRFGDTAGKSGQCWAIQFERMIGNIPMILVTPSHQSDSEPRPGGNESDQYVKERVPETMKMCISDEGILYFDWRNTDKVAATVSENVKLLPFDEVMERAKKNIFYKTYVPEDYSVSITVQSIKLGMMRVVQKDTMDTMLTVPVWDFIGNIQVVAKDGKPVPQRENLSYLTLNAIDGSAIDRERGY